MRMFLDGNGCKILRFPFRPLDRCDVIGEVSPLLVTSNFVIEDMKKIARHTLELPGGR
jgi:hypothetical protein